MSQHTHDPAILNGPIPGTFVRYMIPSILGLMAITTASVVDGMFVGQFVSAEGLAAINLLIPYLSLLFGLALMIAIGGAVRAGHYLGEGNHSAASGLMGLCLLAITIIALAFMSMSLLAGTHILRFLGTPDSLLPLIQPYFRIISAVLVLQTLTMVLYYFIRLDGGQRLATTALTIGALANILLDALLIIVFEMGLLGAAFATAVSQTVQLIILSGFFLRKHRRLQLQLPWAQWRQLIKVAFNGLSELANEISAGVVILVLNLILVKQLGVEGVAAFAVINYLIFVSLMLYYGIADALHLLTSQNHGAGQFLRIQGFVRTALTMVLIVSTCITAMLLIWPEKVSGMFISDASEDALPLSAAYISLVWPLFVINGINVTLAIYLTAMQQPVPSMLIALSRGLVLPVSLLLSLSALLPQPLFLVALPISEWLTFILASLLFWQYRPLHRRWQKTKNAA